MPLLVAPMVVTRIWELAVDPQLRHDDLLTLGASGLVLGWSFLGGGVVLVRLSEAYARRRALRHLRGELDNSEAEAWLADPEGVILAQSPAALERYGDQKQRSLAQFLATRCADAERQAARLLLRAQSRGQAKLEYAGGNVMNATKRECLLHLHLIPADREDDNLPVLDYDLLPIGVLRLDADGTVIQVNRAAEPYRSGAPDRPHVSQLLEGLGRPYEVWLSEAKSSPGPAAPEVMRAPFAGQDRFVQVSLYPERAHGKTLVAVLTDARALKTLEAQFVQSQKMQAIGKLAGGIAHDFNNLLTAISGHCDLLMLRRDSGDPDYADLAQISQNANRAANLVNHLLAFSRKQKLKPQRVDMRETLSDLSHLLRRLVGNGIAIDYRHDPGLNPVRADRSKVEQVVMNLVVNARDAMPQGGTVEIVTENIDLTEPERHGRFAVPRGRYVRVVVRDQGCGIAPDVLDRIFEPFFTTKSAGRGTGLGLSTVYGIVKQTGGYITCESRLGEGTQFTIYLPVHTGNAEEESDDAHEAEAAPVRPTHAGKSVLLVEDEAPVRAFAARALKMNGYQVTEAGSGEEALSLLANEELRIDLFLSDVVMPGMGGPAWVQRALAARPVARVVFMSGYAEEVVQGQQAAVEGARFLQKPFALNDLVAVVGEALEAADESGQ
ncbi:ATP-binding protein [Paracoccus sp. SCSIO 75233]|uniref:hybrid sensor histidine kinase/response regulator n=1 Tax=Paracoccus sp. SCSIO 75233 TaxID=3017782 RepID=UPI0022F083D3|nr:ATP-binding protein [Paracoccus sp. SCSIO 75233]WBU54727.1 ATP-binding protein [Paracoccus sp. SCSIO 75233]